MAPRSHKSDSNHGAEIGIRHSKIENGNTRILREKCLNRK